MPTTKKSEQDEPVEGTVIPPEAKKPQDRKAKASDKPEVIEVTVRGIALKVDRDALDDFELLDDLNELEVNENPARLTSIMRRLVGDQWRTVMDELRGGNKRVSVEDGAEFVGELLEAVAPNS